MSNDHTVDGRAKGQVDQELPVKILVHLSVFNAAIKNDSGGFAPGLDEPLAKERRKFLIDLTFRNKLTHDTASGALVRRDFRRCHRNCPYGGGESPTHLCL